VLILCSCDLILPSNERSLSCPYIRTRGAKAGEGLCKFGLKLFKLFVSEILILFYTDFCSESKQPSRRSFTLPLLALGLLKVFPVTVSG